MLTITTTHRPATELGYLLHKHPDRVQHRDTPYGRAHIYFPEASQERCTMALHLDVDPVGLTSRGSQGRNTPASALQDYVNDRPYCANSLLTAALSASFSQSLAGQCKDRPELAQTPIPLSAQITALRSYHGPDLIERILTPLGYRVTIETLPLDPAFPTWGDSPYHNVTLTHVITLQELLQHLYVLIPVIDNGKHYYVAQEEVDKLIKHGGAWLPQHPLRNIITRRYLRHQRQLSDQARATLASLLPPEPSVTETEAMPTDVEPADTQLSEAALEKPLSLSEQRINAVLEWINRQQPRSVIDLGCGEGQLLQRLVNIPTLTRIGAADVSPHALEAAQRRIRYRSMTPQQQARLSMFQTSLNYQDPRTTSYDVAVLMEVIEHIDESRLDTVAEVLFGYSQPRGVIMTTPNVEYNPLFTGIRNNGLRHRDHRFEWTKQQFRDWAIAQAQNHGYSVGFIGIGQPDFSIPAGHPTQMAIFSRIET